MGFRISYKWFAFTKKGNKSKFIEVSNVIATKDIKKSNKNLISKYGKNEQAIAYPYGLINGDKIQAIKNAHMKYGFTLQEKAVTPNVDNYKISRILVSNDAFETLVKKWDGFDEEN